MIIFLDTKRLQLSKLSSDILFKKLCLVECLCDSLVKSILNKEAGLSEYEFSVIKKHPELGAYVLRGSSHAERILEGVLHHHEHMDGNGYPFNLKGDQIGLQAKILAVSDGWDALTSRRPYREAMSYDKAMEIMLKGRGKSLNDILIKRSNPELFLMLVM